MAAVLVGMVLITWLIVRWLTRRRTVRVRAPWDGGVRRLLPEMTYTATGFSNPVRVIFDAIFRPTIAGDTKQTVAEHFRTAIQRQRQEVHIVDRLALQPIKSVALRLARGLAALHHGRINMYIAYGLLSLLLVLALGWLL
jgi:hydrogenase-4 component B